MQNPCDAEEDGKKRHIKTKYLSELPWLVSNFSTLSVKALAHSNYTKLEIAAFTESQNGWGWAGPLEVTWSNVPAQAVPSVSLEPGEMTLYDCALFLGFFFMGLVCRTLTYTSTKCVDGHRAWTPQMKFHGSLSLTVISCLLQKFILWVQLPLLTAARSKDVDRAFFHNAISSR